MEVILLERVEKLGQMGDLVRVKDGFARNYLLPRGKALRATEANKKRFDTQKAELEARNLERKSEAEAVSKKLDGAAIVIIRQAGESGQLYGSVAARDITDTLDQQGFKVDKNQVILDKPVKTLGLFDQRVQLHPEVLATITVNVARSEEEAERQARGEDVLATPEEREAALGIEEVFEEEVIAEVAEELAASEATDEEGTGEEDTPAAETPTEESEEPKSE